MVDSFGRADVERVLESVRLYVRGFESEHAERGIQVTGIEADITPPFPDLLIYLEHDDFEGERVARFSLERNGELKGPSDAAQSIAFGIWEATPGEVRRLPLSGRVSPRDE